MSSNNENNQKTENTEPKFNYYWIYGVILVAIIAINLIPFNSNVKKISEQEFFNKYFTDANHDIDKLVIVNKETAEVYIKETALANAEHKGISDSNFSGMNKGPHYTFKILSPENFDKELRTRQATFPNDKRISIYPDTRTDWRASFITYFLPIIIIIAIWILIMRRVSGGVGGPGGQIFNIGKSKAVLLDGDSQVHITFDDVAGLDEAKEEVLEIVDFLKTPQKYTSLGGKIPKGVLLIGPPGTGKTLLAKAVAGEAQVPFFTISGSDFVELFVGVGASRVRDLFKQAREKAPCIIFIDEIDAIGRARGRNMMQGNDERENTLNALLVEMDGFASDKGVIIMAATNRPDVLDSALLRPGRFDRQIGIDAPDIKGREAIFKVHTTPIKTGDDINTKKLAEQTPGFAGADIANVCNEAALIAARKNKKAVTMIDFQDAIDRVIGGLEKKNKIISPEEKKIIAYHEAGHAIAGWFLKYGHPLLKVTIIPRGVAALGYAQYVPKERYLATIEQLIDGMCVTLGGRVAEDIIFNEISTGAQNDLERITKMAYSMVTIYGMNDKVGNVSFHDPQNEYGFQKPYSNETAQLIDKEVRTIIKNAYDRTKALLLSKRNELEILAEELLKKEILHRDDVERLIGKRPFAEHTEEIDSSKLSS